MNLLASDIAEIVNGLPADFWGQFSGKRVLLTGGRGFLGRYLTEVFAKVNSDIFEDAAPPVSVVVADNMITAGPFGEAGLNDENIVGLCHDVIEPFPFEGDDARFDFILHAAGIASPAYYKRFPIQTYRVATIGTHNVLELARKTPGCRLAFFSSSEIYGNPDPAHVPTDETYNGYVSSLGPRACYDESKRMGEMMVRVHHEQHGVHGTIIRPFNFYGPGMQKTDYRVLPNFAARISEGKPLHVYGDGKQTRTFCYVTDGIRGCLQVLAGGHAGEPYNIGNPDPEISMGNLALLVGDITGTKTQFETTEYPSTYPADEPLRRCPSIDKSRSHVGYEPHVSLADGLVRFFGWAREAYRDPAVAT